MQTDIYKYIYSRQTYLFTYLCQEIKLTYSSIKILKRNIYRLGYAATLHLLQRQFHHFVASQESHHCT